MKSWRVKAFGIPGEVIELVELDTPTPGPGQMLVKVEAAGLGLPDVLMCADNYPLTPPLPFTPSQEAAGTVVAVGEGGDPKQVGRKVLGTTLFQLQSGGLADYCLMAQASSFPIPDTMPAIVAAGFFIPYLTAWVGLARRAQVSAVDTVLVLGASGSSGCAAMQLARARGARVIAVAGGTRKAEFCRSIGADAVIDHRSEDITKRALELTDGKGVNVVFDPVGGSAGRAAFKALAFEGRFVIIGYASGEWAKIHLVETVMKNISLLGAMPVGFSRETMESAVAELVRHWERGEITASNIQVFPFEQGLDAIEHIAAGKVEGKVVVEARR